MNNTRISTEVRNRWETDGILFLEHSSTQRNWLLDFVKSCQLKGKTTLFVLLRPSAAAMFCKVGDYFASWLPSDVLMLGLLEH